MNEMIVQDEWFAADGATSPSASGSPLSGAEPPGRSQKRDGQSNNYKLECFSIKYYTTASIGRVLKTLVGCRA